MKQLFQSSPSNLTFVKRRAKRKRQNEISDQVSELQRHRSLVDSMYNIGITVSLNEDCYSKSFRAFHKASAAKLRLTTREINDGFHTALYVYGIQLFFFVAIYAVITNLTSVTFTITYPNSVIVLATRFACAFLMHLNMKSHVRNALKMMKYANNHQRDFSEPYYAFVLGLMQLTGCLIAEFGAIFYLSSLDSPIDLIIRFMALSQIADVNGIIYRAIPTENRIQKPLEPLKISVHRRDFVVGYYERDNLQKVLRVLYKVLKIVYASFFFYYFPIVIVLLPALVKDF